MGFPAWPKMGFPQSFQTMNSGREPKIRRALVATEQFFDPCHPALAFFHMPRPQVPMVQSNERPQVSRASFSISILNPGIRIFLENHQTPWRKGIRLKRTMAEKNGQGNNASLPHPSKINQADKEPPVRTWEEYGMTPEELRHKNGGSSCCMGRQFIRALPPGWVLLETGGSPSHFLSGPEKVTTRFIYHSKVPIEVHLY